MPPKKAPATRRVRPTIQPEPVEESEGPEGGRTVMQRVDTLPVPRIGRPNDKYMNLCLAVIGEYGAAVPVKLIEFADPKSAYRVMSEITNGKRPVPGGPGEWEVRALVEDVEGQEAKGSALYVEWLGNR